MKMILCMHQKHNLQGLLERFGMKDCKPKYTSRDSNINKIRNESSELTNEKLYREIVES